MRTRAVAATLAAVAVLAAGCGSSDQSGGSSGRATSSSSSSQQAGDGPSMADMDMGSSGKPSDPASMICGLEIQDAVMRTFAMSSQPTGADQWSRSKRVFSCRWSVPRGTLAMSVQDSLDEKTGQAYFDQLKSRLDGTKIVGMESFGFPAFSTSAGDVVFLKDGKTLQVDATRLPDASLPKEFSRGEAAYSVASAVIACWSE